MDVALTLDGITGPHGECTCNHCQMDTMIDGIVAAHQTHTNSTEGNNDQETIAVYQQVGE